MTRCYTCDECDGTHEFWLVGKLRNPTDRIKLGYVCDACQMALDNLDEVEKTYNVQNSRRFTS